MVKYFLFNNAFLNSIDKSNFKICDDYVEGIPSE